MKLETLLAQRAEWLKRAEFLGRMPIEKHLQYQYFPTYYRTLAWYENQIADAYEAETQESVFPAEVKEVSQL